MNNIEPNQESNAITPKRVSDAVLCRNAPERKVPIVALLQALVRRLIASDFLNPCDEFWAWACSLELRNLVDNVREWPSTSTKDILELENSLRALGMDTLAYRGHEHLNAILSNKEHDRSYQAIRIENSIYSSLLSEPLPEAGPWGFGVQYKFIAAEKPPLFLLMHALIRRLQANDFVNNADELLVWSVALVIHQLLTFDSHCQNGGEGDYWSMIHVVKRLGLIHLVCGYQPPLDVESKDFLDTLTEVRSNIRVVLDRSCVVRCADDQFWVITVDEMLKWAESILDEAIAFCKDEACSHMEKVQFVQEYVAQVCTVLSGLVRNGVWKETSSAKKLDHAARSLSVLSSDLRQQELDHRESNRQKAANQVTRSKRSVPELKSADIDLGDEIADLSDLAASLAARRAAQNDEE